MGPVERIAVAGGDGFVDSEAGRFSDSVDENALILRPGG